MGLSQSEKAAVVLSLLGQELAADIFARLAKAEQVKIIRALTAGRPVSDQDVNEICTEFLNKMSHRRSGLDPSELLRSSKFAGIEVPRTARVSDICDDIPDWILGDYLSRQLDSVVCAVLGFIEPARAAKLLKELPAERQAHLLIVLSKEKLLDALAMDELEADLDALRARVTSGRHGHRVGGSAHVLALVQSLDSELRGQILTDVGAKDPSLAGYLENGLLSVERLAQLLPNHLALLLSQLKDQDIGWFLRGEKAGVQGTYLSCLSVRRRQDVECLLEPAKRITQKQKTEACERLRNKAVALKEEGKLIFPWEESLVG
jgi:flagellar motor switch protein FliG